MIFDVTQKLLLSPPGAGSFVSSSFGIDVAHRFGSGLNPAQAGGHIFGMGDEIGFLCKVATAFAASVGDPILQFHYAASELGDGVFLHSSGKMVALGSYMPALHFANGKTYVGIHPSDLPAGTTFLLRPSPWSNIAARPASLTNAVPAAYDPRVHRYIGVAVTVANASESPNPVATGVLEAYPIKIAEITDDVLGNLPIGAPQA